MEPVYYEANSGLARAKSEARPKKKRYVRWARHAAVLIIWLLVGIGCFLLARNYVGNIQQQLDTIAESNRSEIAILNEKLVVLQTALNEHQTQTEELHSQFALVEQQLEAVKDEMSLTGDTISNAAQTKQALNNRINDLSKELTNLRALIKKLEEAARVY